MIFGDGYFSQLEEAIRKNTDKYLLKAFEHFGFNEQYLKDHKDSFSVTHFPRSGCTVSDDWMKSIEIFEYFYNREFLFGMQVFHEFDCFENDKFTYVLKYRFYDAKGHEIKMEEDSE